LTAVKERSRQKSYSPRVLTGTVFEEVNMRIAILGCLSAAAITIGPVAANAVPAGPNLPTVDSPTAVEKVAGGCGPGWHPVPPHFTRWGHWVPWHCVPNFWWP
jgi:hypothetical protein